MEGKVVIVTGAAQGIGFGIATCFARKGASVVVADINLENAQAAAQKLPAEGAGPCFAVECDVSDRASVEAMIEAVMRQYGQIDVLINNAGICPFIDVMQMTPEVFQRTLDVDLTGAFHCTQLVAQKMIEAGHGGRVVNITSLAEAVTGPAQVDYGAAKGGLRMLTTGFATALGPHGITVNAVAPGMILTPMTQDHWLQPGPAEFIKTRVPVGRIGTPIDIGNACVFLASPEAEYINGISLRVDGGHQALCY
jgi:NAD(P)-dependent dehydrogenase (short-subunit alcohol dehydrogenase family)